jgi:hypothetical protein
MKIEIFSESLPCGLPKIRTDITLAHRIYLCKKSVKLSQSIRLIGYFFLFKPKLKIRHNYYWKNLSWILKYLFEV